MANNKQFSKFLWAYIDNVYYANTIRDDLCDFLGPDSQVGYKAAFYKYKNGKIKPVIIRLTIPKSARRTCYQEDIYEDYGKHRCSKAIVTGFISYYTGKPIKIKHAYSTVDDSFLYTLGEMIFPDKFDSYDLHTCSNGIHYYKDLEMARCHMDDYLVYDLHKKHLKLRKNHMWKPFFN